MAKLTILVCILLVISTYKIYASKPFDIQPPPKLFDDPGTDTRQNATIDELIRNVLESHQKNGDSNVIPDSTVAMLMSDDMGMVLAEMDMLLNPDQYKALYGEPSSNSRQKRKVYEHASPWKDGVVPYILSPWDFTGNERAIIHLAMQEWEQYTCIKFRPSNSSDADKLVFKNGIGCNSQVGHVGGAQVLNLEAPGCRFKGLYLHEIGHALGLVHEHQLPNRDDHIEIIWDNVKPSWKRWFNKYAASEFTDSERITYDLSSVMHYGITAFSKDSKLQTIKAKDKSMEYKIGRVYKKELAFVDIKTINDLYKCSAHCKDDIRCSNGGFVDKHCICHCPDGTNNCQEYPRVPPKPVVNCTNIHDDDEECEKWVKRDQCSLNPVWMLENCRKSCGKCELDEVVLPPKICDNRYNDTDCDKYAKTGECSANPAWMFYNCKASCGWCAKQSECQDYYPDSSQCKEWKRTGYCDRNPAWMWANCRQTCGMCKDPPAGCSNKAGDDKCFADASVGECKSNPAYMLKNCAMACAKCGDCYNEFTDDSACIDLAKAGECTLSPEWMGKYCKKACRACNSKGLPIGEARPCADKDERCGGWAKQSECDINPSWMIPNCQKSCDRCNCTNKHDDKKCDVWASTGECESNTPWMAKNCQRSCKFCTNLPPPPDRCTDKYTKNPIKCKEWAANGECFKNPLFMIPKCRKSCTKCDSVTDCEDWSSWSAWTGCSRTCGKGMRSRTRQCLDSSGGTQDEMIGCSPADCPSTTTSPPITTTSGYKSTTESTTVTTETPISECKNKYHKDSDCENWAKHGHCDSNPTWMHDNCAKSCKICASKICKNKYEDDLQCDEWARDNQCTDNPGWMLSNCAKSCNQCEDESTETSALSCKNTHSSDKDCDNWASRNQCKINPSFMLTRCAKSCDSCGTQITVSPTTTAPTVTTALPPPVCKDKHKSCEVWSKSKRNYCETNMYVRINCKFSCKTCSKPSKEPLDDYFSNDQCYDRSADCIQLALDGKCVTDFDDMKLKCPFSCEHCQPGQCIDTDSNCSRWADTHACHIFPRLMAKKCKLSCKYCSSSVSANQP